MGSMFEGKPFVADPLASEATLEELIQAFEAGSITKAAWTHSAHLIVGGYYALTHPEAQALTRLRAGIHFLNECQGTPNTPSRGYHETLTRFWLAIVRGFLAQYLATRVGVSRVEVLQALVATYGGRRDLAREYYSTDIVKSTNARRMWVAPDLQPLPPVQEAFLSAFRSAAIEP